MDYISKAKQKAKSLGIEIYSSNAKNKKFYTIYQGKKIHFGDNRYEDFLQHGDKKRRELYRARASKIKDKKGNYTYLDKTKPNYYSYHILW